MKILYLTTVLANNKKTGGEIATFQCIESLRLKYKVDVVGYKRKAESIDLHDNDNIVKELIIESTNSKFWTLLWMFLAYINGRSFSSQKFYTKKYTKTVKKMLKENSYDLVIIEHSQLSWILGSISPEIPIIFNSQNVEYLVYQELSSQSNRIFKKMVYLRESKLMKSEETILLKRSTQVWVLSSSDMKEYKKLVKHSSIYVINIPGGFDTLKECTIKYDIGILGTWSWESNKKGLEWFLERILPLINERYTITLGGKDSLNYKERYSNVNAIGFVSNAQNFLSSCKVIVIPTVAGGGIQIKTLDAISTNRPIVTTPIGVRGIDPLPTSLYVTIDEKKFSAQIDYLLNEESECNNGYKWSKERKLFFKEQLISYIENLMISKRETDA